MSCPACGRDNRPGARFCADCGTALAARCAACQAELPPDARFCDGCGAPVASGAGTQTRKVVTVVFADLAGSTSLQEHLDPESVRHLMDGFYGALRAAVETHGGTTVKLTGDGLMAAFGVQSVAEDDAWRAVQAAAAMQQAFTQLAWDPSVALRVGVNTGEVIVTEGEADVVGDAVNVAARLEAAADSGGVLVGEETWRVTRHLARFEAVPPLTLRGKADPVPAYRLVSAADPVADVSGPFVGRDSELARLTDLFDEVQHAGVVRLAAVVGSPGLGKSRLAAEVIATLSHRATVFEARFSATSAPSTLVPVVDALRSALTDAEIDDVLSASPQTAFLTVRRAIETLAQLRPVVLVLEDLHWAEPLALDLVEHLVEWTQAAPVLLLALARPELRELRSSLVDTSGRAAVVTVLEGLDPVASERLACDLLDTDELPPALVARILEGSEGNPLFVRELVRMLVDDGVLQPHGREWRSTIEVDAITVPPTIQSLLAARVERLAVDERTVLECAAIVGREFYRGAVAALVPGGVRSGLDRILERLRQKEMIEPAGTYWIDEPVLRFHHVLLRDAAYRRLLKEVRAELHERHAGWLEAKVGVGGDNDEVLGYHLEQAHHYRTELGLFDERTALLGHRAATRLATAGRRALDRDDLPTAAGLLGRALARMAGDDPERAALLIDRCEALLATGAVTDAGLAVAELRALADGSPRLRAWATCFAAQLAILTEPGYLQETAALVEHAAVELAKLADAAGAAKAHAVHASALARLGRVAETEAALDRALAAAREAGDGRRATGVLAGAPVAALWGPSPVARASGRCLDVVRVLRITSSATTVEATSLRCQAVLEALRGRTDAARRMLGSARRSLEELGHRHGLLSTDMFLGLVELLADDAAAAEQALQRAHQGFLELGAGADAGQAAALLARAVLAQDRTDEAEALTVESERLGGADLKTAIAWRAVRAEALARRGLFDDALGLARAAVALAEPTDALLDQADTHLAMATVLQLAGRHDEAQASARRAVDLYERKGATVPAERAAALIAPSPANVPASNHRVPASHGDNLTRIEFFGAEELPQAHARLAELTQRMIPRQTLIATRGDEFQLCRLVYHGQTADGDRGEVAILHVSRYDAEGRITEAGNFEADDFDGAMAYLDERYLASLPPEVADVASIGIRFVRSYNERRWDEHFGLLAEDFESHDHRPAGQPRLDRDGFERLVLGLVDVAPDARIEMIEIAAATTQGLVAITTLRGTGDLVGVSELLRAQLVRVRDGRIVRFEHWPVDEVDAAVARLRAAGTVDPAPGLVLDNAAVRASQRYGECVERADWAGFRSLCRPDAYLHDRRAALQSRFDGVELLVQNAQQIADLAQRVSVPLATRGERLVLLRSIFTGDLGEFEVEALEVGEVDEEGLLVGSVVLEADDLDEAFAELDRRFRAGEGAPFLATLDLGDGLWDAYERGDWLAFEGMLAADLVVTDHRGMGFGARSRSGYLASSQALHEITPDMRSTTLAVPRVSERAMVAVMQFAGTYADGTPFERPFIMVTRWRGAQLYQLETFPTDALADAIARFDELARDDEASIVGPNACAPNRAWAVSERVIETWLARDWEHHAELYHRDATWEDRRPGLHASLRGRHQITVLSKVVSGVTATTRTLVATRGERLSLGHAVLVGDDPERGKFEVETLQVMEIDEADQVVAIVQLDPSDMTAAYAELDRRFTSLSP